MHIHNLEVDHQAAATIYTLYTIVNSFSSFDVAFHLFSDGFEQDLKMVRGAVETATRSYQGTALATDVVRGLVKATFHPFHLKLSASPPAKVKYNPRETLRADFLEAQQLVEDIRDRALFDISAISLIEKF